VSRNPLKDGLEFGLFRVLTGVLFLVPERLSMTLGALTGWFAGYVLRLRKRVVDEHLLLAFPDESDAWRRRVARECYLHLGRETVAIFRLSRLTSDQLRSRTTMVGFEAFEAAMALGKGVILMTGHLGNWEVGAAGFTARGVPFDAVAKSMQNSRFGEALISARAGIGMGVIDVDVAPRRVLESLRAGRSVAILADQNAHRGGIFVPFFGKMASTARGPALFALRSGAPMMLAIPLRDPGPGQTYTVTIEPIEFEATGDRPFDIRQLTVAHTQALERAIRRAPGQYLWHHKRWKKRPDAGSGPVPG
jgi:Kdo2-lipid IVA lauroyltransferase/acyltransferase